MLIPLSWISEYTKVKLPIKELATLMSEVGLTIEKWEEKDGDTVIDTEVTPNRPDWLSVVGTAREIAAATNEAFNYKEVVVPLKGIKKTLPITLRNNFQVAPRICSITISGLTVKPSPDWLQKRIKQIGLRPINNLVDITNYVLWELGTPIHTFDYDKISGAEMTVAVSKGGEKFRSLDGVDYILPPDAIIISDKERIIDLVPLKGGENTSITAETTNVLMHTIIADPVMTRRTSQALGLRSDASALSERGVDPNALPKGLHRALALILELAGGEVASEMIDTKAEEFLPKELLLDHSHLEKIIGIAFKEKDVVDILKRLELPTKVKGNIYAVTIPTFRPDLVLEEDLIEEVTRIYNYNNLPRTLPQGSVPTNKVAYSRDYDQEYAVKQLLSGLGYSEVYTYSLVSEDHLLKLGISPEATLRITNPISRDFEYLRPRMLGSLLESFKVNQANFSEIKLFELGKHYSGSLEKVSETYWISAVLSGQRFFEAKGAVETLLTKLGIPFTITAPKSPDTTNTVHPGRDAEVKSGSELIGYVSEIHPELLEKFGVKQRVTAWTLNYDLISKLSTKNRTYQAVPKYPGIREDISLVTLATTLVGDIIEIIKKADNLVTSVELLDIHDTTKTFRIVYLNKAGNLEEKDVRLVREKILKLLEHELKVTLKS